MSRLALPTAHATPSALTTLACTWGRTSPSAGSHPLTPRTENWYPSPPAATSASIRACTSWVARVLRDDPAPPNGSVAAPWSGRTWPKPALDDGARASVPGRRGLQDRERVAACGRPRLQERSLQRRDRRPLHAGP